MSGEEEGEGGEKYGEEEEEPGNEQEEEGKGERRHQEGHAGERSDEDDGIARWASLTGLRMHRTNP